MGRRGNNISPSFYLNEFYNHNPVKKTCASFKCKKVADAYENKMSNFYIFNEQAERL